MFLLLSNDVSLCRQRTIGVPEIRLVDTIAAKVPAPPLLAQADDVGGLKLVCAAMIGFQFTEGRLRGHTLASGCGNLRRADVVLVRIPKNRAARQPHIF